MKKKSLANFFTNLNDNVFCLINLPEVVKGALFSRYSRSSLDLRSLFEKEFLNQSELGELFLKEKSSNKKILNLQKAEDFYERILIGYGDDSVAELGGAHLAVENISMLATKSLEEHRLGLSFLEKSTRYVYFDKKINGRYLYYQDKKIASSKYQKEFNKVINYLFDTYSLVVRNLQPLLKKIYPGDEREKAYLFSIRAKACDLARGLLPLAALTNLGVYGNGRAFEYLLTHLLNDPLDEVRIIGLKMNENLRQVIPAFIKRATNEKGEAFRQYLVRREENLSKIINQLMKREEEKTSLIKTPTIRLIDYDKKGEEKIIAAILYQRSNKDFKTCLKIARGLSGKKKEAIFDSFLKERQNRFHKPGRELEEIYFSFEIIADWGVYKDLMRHRVLTRYRQLFTNSLGFYIPKEVKMVGLAKEFQKSFEAAVDLYEKMKVDLPNEAQYLVLHGSYNRFYLKLNLRELVHLTELRSSLQGHPSYRKIAQEMAKIVINQYPILGRAALKFVDYNDYSLERLEAFKKLEKKAKKLGIDVFK